MLYVSLSMQWSPPCLSLAERLTHFLPVQFTHICIFLIPGLFAPPAVSSVPLWIIVFYMWGLLA